MASTQTREPKLKITRSPGRNPCFDEKLGEGMALRMMQIPGGTFMMGSPENELDNYSDEQPQHEVSVAAFYIGKYPITQAQWRFVAALEQIEAALEADPSKFKGDNRPVEQVSWDEAVEFCRRITQHTGRLYHLPSEAQWEYACRAGTTSSFHFGRTITTEIANYRAYAGPPLQIVSEEATTSVINYDAANTYGLCDMHGNVRELCADAWHDSYHGAPTDSSVWDSSSQITERVLRGGHWQDNPTNCRSAARTFMKQDKQNLYSGLRVCCENVAISSSPVAIVTKIVVDVNEILSSERDVSISYSKRSSKKMKKFSKKDIEKMMKIKDLLSGGVEGFPYHNFQKLHGLEKDLYAYRMTPRDRAICRLTFSDELNKYNVEVVDITDHSG